MIHISGFERSQLLLLAEAVDDYVGFDDPVRFIDAFVDGLDLAVAGFRRVEPKATGRPGYAPAETAAGRVWEVFDTEPIIADAPNALTHLIGAARRCTCS